MDDPDQPPESINKTYATQQAETLQRLERDVAALVASVDQQQSELEAINVIVLLTVFAFGALAGIVFLQGRQLRELSGAS